MIAKLFVIMIVIMLVKDALKERMYALAVVYGLYGLFTLMLVVKILGR